MRQSSVVATVEVDSSRVRPTRRWGRLSLRWMLEGVVLLIIVGLVLVTWMPAIVTHLDEKDAEQVDRPK